MNLSILNHKKILVSYGLIEIFLFSSMLEGDVSYSIETGCVLSFCRTKSNKVRRLSSIGSIKFGNRTHRKGPVPLSSIIELIEQQCDRVRLIFGLFCPGRQEDQDK